MVHKLIKLTPKCLTSISRFVKFHILKIEQKLTEKDTRKSLISTINTYDNLTRLQFMQFLPENVKMWQ